MRGRGEGEDVRFEIMARPGGNDDDDDDEDGGGAVTDELCD